MSTSKSTGRTPTDRHRRCARRARPARVTRALVLAAAYLFSVSFGRPVPAHDLDVKLNGLDAITEILIPAFGDHEIYVYELFKVKDPSSTPGPDEPGWDCEPIYAAPAEDENNLPEELQGHPNLDKYQEPDLEYGELPDSAPDIVGWDCVEALEWDPRFNCRDWIGAYMVEGTIPVNARTFDSSFGNNGRVNTDFDLSDGELTVTIFIVGETVEGLGCVHPFNDTIIYIAEVTVGGVSGTLDVTLAAAEDSTVYVEEIHPNTFDLEFDDDGIEFELYTNNQLVNWFVDPDAIELVGDLASVVLGALGGESCGSMEDCLGAIVRDILKEEIDLSALHESLDSEKLMATLLSQINDAIELPLSWSRDVVDTQVRVPTGTGVNTSQVATEILADLDRLASSRADNTMTATFAVEVLGSDSGTCGALAGFAAPAAGDPTPLDTDLVFTVPFSLVGDLVQKNLQQLNLCNTPLNFGTFSGQIAPNGPLTVARTGPKQLSIDIPMACSATAPAVGSFTFDNTTLLRPTFATAGEIELELISNSIQNLAGTIRTRLGGRLAVYTFGGGIANLQTGGVTYPAPDIGPAIEAQVNAQIARLFPMRFGTQTTAYIAPHVYVELRDSIVDTGSFSLGVDIRDGSQPVDVSVTGVEGAAPYVDKPLGALFLREVPLKAIILNRDSRDVAPPVDVTIEIGALSQTLWLPPLEPKEEYEVPFSVSVVVDAAGRVVLSPTVTIYADKGDPEPTIVDPERENNVYEFAIDDAWFAPDYAVEIGDVEVLSLYRASGTTIISHEIVSSDFTIPVTVKNLGMEAGSRFSLLDLNVYVNDELYEREFISGDLQVAEESEMVFEIHVPEGPYALYCTYEVVVEIAVSDGKRSNNDDSRSITVESSSCVGGGPTDADLQQLEEEFASGDLAGDKFDGLNTVEWGEDRPNGNVDTGGSNAPILDRLED